MKIPEDVFRRISAVTVLSLLLFLIMLFIALMEPRFIKPSNLINLVRQSSIIGLVAFGMTCVILASGIDLSVGSVLALSALVAASAAKAGVPVVLAWATAIAVGGICGMITGYFVGALRVPPFIASLGMMGAARGLALLYTQGGPITGFSRAFRLPGAGWIAGIPVPVFILIAAFLFFRSLLDLSVWGRKVRCLGSNPVASWGTGINVARMTASVYVISGMAAALAGLMLAGRLDSAQPTAGLGYEFGAIAAVVLGGTQFTGGKGKISGTLLGVFIIGVIENGMNILNINPFYEQVVKGTAIALALVIYGKLASSSKKDQI